MSQQDNVEFIRHWYANVRPEYVAEQVDWKLADGFPADGHFHTRDEVFKVWWPKLIAQFETWSATADEVFAIDDDRVLGLGHYAGRAKATGREFKVPFAHVWTVRDRQITKVAHHTNPWLLQRALGNV